MRRRDVEITIDRDGNVQMRVRGMKGKACLDLTAALEQGLGEVSGRELTQEYYESESGTEVRTET